MVKGGREKRPYGRLEVTIGEKIGVLRYKIDQQMLLSFSPY
jgi:hypothetical protein